jgi:outer membrane biosynthesis protein TonB
MQTIDSYVIYSSPEVRWRPRRTRAPLAAVALFATVAIAAGFTFLGRAGDPSTTASRAKSDARVVAESSAASRSDDEARIAAFQESVAISHVTPAAPAAGADEPQTAEVVAKPTDQPAHKPAQKPAPKSAVAAAPVPQPRPATPEVIMADLPPAPPVPPAPAEAKPHFLAAIAKNVERAPGEVQDFAHAMTDRLLGGFADVRGRVGL